MAYRNAPTHSTRRSSKKLLIVFCLAAIALIGMFVFLHTRDDTKTSKENTPSPETSHREPEPSPVVSIDLQPVIDSWIAKQAATYSIVVYDTKTKQIIGSNQPDEVMFAASLYKLFVAYLALEDFQTGAQKPDEMLIGGNTRKVCVDRMIRESYSPCGEAMMADMGPSALEARVKAMGITNTYFSGIRTTARDTARILQYIVEKKDLNDQNTAFLRDAMRTQEQKFKNGLALGAPEALVDSKVGWNETSNYHDVGILTMPNDRQYVVSILSQGNGSSKPIADFASTIYATLKE